MKSAVRVGRSTRLRMFLGGLKRYGPAGAASSVCTGCCSALARLSTGPVQRPGCVPVGRARVATVPGLRAAPRGGRAAFARSSSSARAGTRRAPARGWPISAASEPSLQILVDDWKRCRAPGSAARSSAQPRMPAPPSTPASSGSTGSAPRVGDVLAREHHHRQPPARAQNAAASARACAAARRRDAASRRASPRRSCRSAKWQAARVAMTCWLAGPCAGRGRASAVSGRYEHDRPKAVLGGERRGRSCRCRRRCHRAARRAHPRARAAAARAPTGLSRRACDVVGRRLRRCSPGAGR